MCSCCFKCCLLKIFTCHVLCIPDVVYWLYMTVRRCDSAATVVLIIDYWCCCCFFLIYPLWHLHSSWPLWALVQKKYSVYNNPKQKKSFNQDSFVRELCPLPLPSPGLLLPVAPPTESIQEVSSPGSPSLNKETWLATWWRPHPTKFGLCLHENCEFTLF